MLLLARLFFVVSLIFCIPLSISQDLNAQAKVSKKFSKQLILPSGKTITIPAEKLKPKEAELVSVEGQNKKLILRIPLSTFKEEAVKTPAVPLITAFKSDKTEIRGGEGIKVWWYTKGAQAIEVQCDDGIFFNKASLSDQIAQGGLVLKPKTSTRCTLFAYKNGEVDQQHVDVLVEGQPLLKKPKEFVELDLNCAGPCKIEGEGGYEKIVVKVLSEKEAKGSLIAIPELGQTYEVEMREGLEIVASLKKEHEIFKQQGGVFQIALSPSEEAQAFNQYLDSKVASLSQPAVKQLPSAVPQDRFFAKPATPVVTREKRDKPATGGPTGRGTGFSQGGFVPPRPSTGGLGQPIIPQLPKGPVEPPTPQPQAGSPTGQPFVVKPPSPDTLPTGQPIQPVSPPAPSEPGFFSRIFQAIKEKFGEKETTITPRSLEQAIEEGRRDPRNYLDESCDSTLTQQQTGGLVGNELEDPTEFATSPSPDTGEEYSLNNRMDQAIEPPFGIPVGRNTVDSRTPSTQRGVQYQLVSPKERHFDPPKKVFFRETVNLRNSGCPYQPPEAFVGGFVISSPDGSEGKLHVYLESSTGGSSCPPRRDQFVAFKVSIGNLPSDLKAIRFYDMNYSINGQTSDGLLPRGKIVLIESTNRGEREISNQALTPQYYGELDFPVNQLTSRGGRGEVRLLISFPAGTDLPIQSAHLITLDGFEYIDQQNNVIPTDANGLWTPQSSEEGRTVSETYSIQIRDIGLFPNESGEPSQWRRFDGLPRLQDAAGEVYPLAGIPQTQSPDGQRIRIYTEGPINRVNVSGGGAFRTYAKGPGEWESRLNLSEGISEITATGYNNQGQIVVSTGFKVAADWTRPRIVGEVNIQPLGGKWVDPSRGFVVEFQAEDNLGLHSFVSYLEPNQTPYLESLLTSSVYGLPLFSRTIRIKVENIMPDANGFRFLLKDLAGWEVRSPLIPFSLNTALPSIECDDYIVSAGTELLPCHVRGLDPALKIVWRWKKEGDGAPQIGPQGTDQFNFSAPEAGSYLVDAVYVKKNENIYIGKSSQMARIMTREETSPPIVMGFDRKNLIFPPSCHPLPPPGENYKSAVANMHFYIYRRNVGSQQDFGEVARIRLQKFHEEGYVDSYKIHNGRQYEYKLMVSWEQNQDTNFVTAPATANPNAYFVSLRQSNFADDAILSLSFFDGVGRAPVITTAQGETLPNFDRWDDNEGVVWRFLSYDRASLRVQFARGLREQSRSEWRWEQSVMGRINDSDFLPTISIRPDPNLATDTEPSLKTILVLTGDAALYDWVLTKARDQRILNRWIGAALNDRSAFSTADAIFWQNAITYATLKPAAGISFPFAVIPAPLREIANNLFDGQDPIGLLHIPGYSLYLDVHKERLWPRLRQPYSNTFSSWDLATFSILNPLAQHWNDLKLSSDLSIDLDRLFPLMETQVTKPYLFKLLTEIRDFPISLSLVGEAILNFMRSLESHVRGLPSPDPSLLKQLHWDGAIWLLAGLTAQDPHDPGDRYFDPSWCPVERPTSIRIPARWDIVAGETNHLPFSQACDRPASDHNQDKIEFYLNRCDQEVRERFDNGFISRSAKAEMDLVLRSLRLLLREDKIYFVDYYGTGVNPHPILGGIAAQYALGEGTVRLDVIDCYHFNPNLCGGLLHEGLHSIHEGFYREFETFVTSVQARLLSPYPMHPHFPRLAMDLSKNARIYSGRLHAFIEFNAYRVEREFFNTPCSSPTALLQRDVLYPPSYSKKLIDHGVCKAPCSLVTDLGWMNDEGQFHPWSPIGRDSPW